jgi:hypothetical protein
MPVTSNVEMVGSRFPQPSSPMIPGQREAGSLTRFAVTPDMVRTGADVTIDAAARADRQREGGGAPSERRPARLSRWAALVALIGAPRIRKTPLAAAVVRRL